MTPSLAEQGIRLNIIAPVPETKYILKERCSWEVVIDLAKNHRIKHPEEPVELIPTGDFWTVYRVVVS